MSFGNITLMLDKTIQILNYNIGKKSCIGLGELSQIKKQVYHDLQKEFADVTPEIVYEIFNRLFSHKLSYESNISFDSGKNCFRELEDKYPDIKTPSKYKQLNAHFNKLKELPQPAQRSQEWYDYRYNRITASDMAAAIDLNPYEPVESFILKKCDPNFPFRDNATVFHGKKYEPTATMIYEHIYNTRVFEFGALPSEQYKFLGASPDGICSKYTLDNKFSERLGTMLEIKCPVTREITTSGKIAGDICPFYYYCQVQQQLVCCELDKCDFWQCKLSEYPNKEAYLSDDCRSCANTIDTSGVKMQVDDRLKKGIILEFYPKKFIPEFDGDEAEWKSKYIIPKRLDMDDVQYESWSLEMLDKYKELYPEISKDYYFYRIIYWKLESSHNVEIVRDDKFFSSILPILKETWTKILYYRKHQDKLDELKQITEKRKKYVKMTTSYLIHNNEIVKNKFKILSDGFDVKVLIKKAPPQPKSSYYSKNFVKKEPVEKTVDYDSDYCDFIDNDDCNFIDDVPVVNVKSVKLNKKDVSEQTPIKTESKIQNLINSKTIKHTEFFKKETTNTTNGGSNSFIRKYDIKSMKNSSKDFKSNKSGNNSGSDECDFID
jgi:putative phage-type endonuclease